MEKQKQQQKEVRIPQFKVRTNVSAGGSLAACQENLDYWKNAYEQKCLLK